MDWGLYGGIIGGMIGIAGGAVGTYASIHNAKTSAERHLLVRASIVLWCSIAAFVALMLTLPKPYNFFLWIPYGLLFPWYLLKLNKQIQDARNG